MNRGSMSNTSKCSSGARRFNEAPIHESGKSQLKEQLHARRSRFNEAPIHESGKSQKGINDDFHQNCFNEAPIHESGK